MARRTAEGKTKKEIIRCLKRHLARQLFGIIRLQFATTRTLVPNPKAA